MNATLREASAASHSGLCGHNRHALLYFFLAGGGNCSCRSCFIGLLRGRRYGKRDWQKCALVRSGCHVIQLCRTRGLYRVQQHVRAWRRVSGGEGSYGWDAWPSSPSQLCSLTTFLPAPSVRFLPDSTWLALCKTLSARLGHPVTCSRSIAFAALFGMQITLYFWWKNIQGIHESSKKALWIMQITTVMVVILIGWCLFTLSRTGFHLPPAPLPVNMKLNSDFFGWLSGSWFSSSDIRRPAGWVWSLRSGDEWRGIAGPGKSGDPITQAEKS